jgi:hypothetical protein
MILQETIIDATQRWLARDDVMDWPHSPLEVIKPLLATEVESRRSDGLSLTLRSHPLNVEVVKGLRDRVLDLAFREARSADAKRAVDAVKTIEASIIYPPGLFGRQVLREECDRWTPLFVETIDRLGRLAADKSLEPAVSVAASRALRWHAQHSTTATQAAAKAALAKVSDSIERQLAQVLHDGWSQSIAFSDDVEEFERRRQTSLDEAVSAATSEWSDDEVVDRVRERLTVNRLAYGQNSGNPIPFVWTLIENRPGIGDIICRRVIEDPSTILRDLVPVVLGRLASGQPSSALTRAHQLLATKNIVIQRLVAQAFGWGRGNREGVIDGEAELLRSLVQHGDPTVRLLAVAAARTLSKSRHPLALELVTTVRFVDSSEIGEEVAGAFGPGYLSWTQLSTLQAGKFLEQLRACPGIDGHQVLILLGAISREQPELVLDLLKGRVEAYERGRPLVKYAPLPQRWDNGLHFRESEHFVESLRSIVGWMAEVVESWPRQREGADIFAAVAERFDQQVLEILTEAIQTGDKRQIQAVGAILRKAPRPFVWEDVPFVTQTLRAAEKHGEDCVQAVGAGFHAAVTTGGRWGTPGQPFREDIEQRDKSAAIAATLPRGSIEQRFYQSLVASAESRIRWEQDHDPVFTDGRDW